MFSAKSGRPVLNYARYIPTCAHHHLFTTTITVNRSALSNSLRVLFVRYRSCIPIWRGAEQLVVIAVLHLFISLFVRCSWLKWGDDDDKK